MSTTDPRTENFPLAAESREAMEGALREQRPLTPTERVIAGVEAYTPEEAAERTLANEMLADTRPGVRQPLLINLGPNHPSTHGVLRLIVELDGEVVKEVTPVIGYLHTGIEKQCENKTWWQAITLVTRMDYLAPFANITAYTMSVEKLLGIEVPSRAEWIRVLLAEMNRLARQFCRGSATIQGAEQVRAGTTVKISGLQQGINGEVFVVSSRHIISNRTGYTTEFSFCSTSLGA